jgi:hypothetical protein
MPLLHFLSPALLPHTPPLPPAARLTLPVWHAVLFSQRSPHRPFRLALGPSDFLLELVEQRPRFSMTVHMVVVNRCNQRVVSELMRGVFGYNAMALQRGPKVLRHYLLSYPVLEVDEPDGSSVEGNVLKHPLGMLRSFGFNGRQEGAERFHKSDPDGSSSLYNVAMPESISLE